MSAVNLEEAKRFCRWIGPDDEEFDFRTFYPKEKPDTGQHYPRNHRGSLNDKRFAERLIDRNEGDYGVFLTVNRTDGYGNTADHITGIRAVWAELDNGMPAGSFPLQPSFIVETSPGKFHVYWLLRDEMTLQEFAGVMARLVQDYGADPNATDVARVLRVPGFYHTKGKPFRCRIFGSTDDGNGVIDYTAAGLLKAFAPIENKRGKQAKAGKRGRTRTLAAIVDDFDPETVASALDALPDHFGTDYNTGSDEGWRNIMFAIHAGSGGSEEGWKVLDKWSRQFEGHNRRANRELWDNAQHDRGEKIRLGSLFYYAEKYGWERPEKQVTVEVQTPTGTKKTDTVWPVPNTYGRPADHIKNVVHFISELKGIQPWLNEFDRDYYLDGYERGDRLTDAALRDLRMQLHNLDCRVSIDLMESGVKWLADNNPRHPLREYLDNLEWDGKPRLSRWLITYLGTKDTAFTRAVSRASLIAAVRRVQQPGCLVREMLVLEGPQNAGKSSMIRLMAGTAYFSDSLPLGADAKETIEETAGKWIVEFPELSNKTKREVEEVKASISRTHDTARTAYARIAQTVARQFVAWGSTNNQRYLRDRTGNTRFWPIKVGHIDLKALRADRNQLWAEAAHFEDQDEPHWLTGNLADDAATETAKREVVNPIEEKLSELLHDAPGGFVPSEELWKALGLTEVKQRQQHHLDSMGDATRKLEWRWARKRNGAGKQVPGYLAPDVAAAGACSLKYNEIQKALVRVH